ncbi:metal-dependent hydrolase [Sporosarcina thermotolerans]|uniref:Metal-dependent hydrolase n=1 Tax=Sporosarcina thermotolerans TaxID=633404 RepID=A0AAW9A8F8_9BACL|nr:metal-dependent hydrolase [Sporosarcina thermotolerans]MDW0116155.1 metal-dependent hydrolase [Sporosarcina thermotolerans]WHT48126.1 metal-dependent hydrolase [Sporosarcina thermotolerans]
MKGSSHAAIGAAAGAIAGYQVQPDLYTVIVSSLVGGASALVPDLDTNGLASNRITISKKFTQWLMQFVGIGILVAIAYQFFTTGFTPSIILYAGIGLLFFIVSRFITQRRMLTLTGIMVMWLGIVMHQSTGILLAGSYIVIASFLPHRSYTHSLLGLAFYAFILSHLQQEWAFEGLFVAGIAGYASHLIADMKLLPMNRRGVKWFAPLWNKEL